MSDKRFQVFFYSKAQEMGLEVPDCGRYETHFSILYDMSCEPPKMLQTDQMEVEDVSFYRDLAWVPVLLNEVWSTPRNG